MATEGELTREEYVEKIDTKLQALFPYGTDDAEEKRAEVLAYAAEEAVGRAGVRDLAAAADLPLADLENLWRAVDGIVDAHCYGASCAARDEILTKSG